MATRFTILGAGPAGVQAATHAARLGADVTMVERDLVWLDVPYGKVLVFSPNCLHGNVVNRVPTTRWSMNCPTTGRSSRSACSAKTSSSSATIRAAMA